MSAARRGRVSFQGVWKQFQRGEFHDSLRDLVPSLLRRLAGRGPPAHEREQLFWALKDVSFEVEAGEVLGIIGANGAGKSTTLKILTSILAPTRGHYHVEGRVGALLEIAAGFHQDLTGRENVYLQGAIMGMTQREIGRRFEEIVEFSGVRDFIDTPVKRYSSGMNARLGFAIAVHLDPDVLIIDEVLSVGDFAFQQQAFDRIRALVESGVPVVMVSHQLDRVASLCNRALLLDHGEVRTRGTPEQCIVDYVSNATQHAVTNHNHDLPVQLLPLAVTPAGPIPSGQRVTIRLEGRIHAPLGATLDPCGLRIVSAESGREVFATSAHECGIELPSAEGSYAVEIDLQLNLQPGVYLAQPTVLDWTLWRCLAMGPLSYLHVSQGPPFRGHSQLDARMRVVPGTRD